MSISTPQPQAEPKLPNGFAPRLLSFDVYGTLVNTPPANHAVFRAILADAGRTDVDPAAFYSFWEQRNIVHYREPYRTYKDICRLSLSETYRQFGVTTGREEAIQRFFDCLSSMTLYPDVMPMRRYFYDQYVSDKSPLAAEVLVRVRALYAIEAEIRGDPAEHRRAVRQERSRPIVEALHLWLQDQVKRVSGASDLAKAMRYAIRHWPGLVVFLDDGRVEMDTNVVERAIRPNTLTRKNALFAGSDGGAKHWALAMTLIQTAKLNGVDPLAWLTDVLERIVSGRTKAHEMHTLLPWTWAAANSGAKAEQLAA